MSDMKKNAPELRFKGFVDDWEQRKLGEVAEFNPKSILPEQFEYVDLESVVGTDLISHRTEKKESAPSRAQRLAKRGDVFYQTVRPYQKNNYLFDLPYENFVFSTGYAQMRPNIDSYFLLSRVQEGKFVSNVLDNTTGTSYPAINANDLSQIKIGIPLSMKEQTKIGKFFKQLDKTIALYQDKREKLGEEKRAYLELIFKQKIRFSSFSEEWELRNLDSLVDRIKSYSLSRDVETSEYTGYKYIHYGDIHTKVADIIDESSNLPNIKAGNYELLEKGDVVLADASEDYKGIATPAVITIDTPYKLVSGLHTIALRPIEIDSLYFYYLINSPIFRRYGYRIGTGMKVFGISATNLLKFESMIPSLEEQAKIGMFFKKIDEYIALHDKKLTKLNELKKAYLQKMFV